MSGEYEQEGSDKGSDMGSEPGSASRKRALPIDDPRSKIIDSSSSVNSNSISNSNSNSNNSNSSSTSSCSEGVGVVKRTRLDGDDGIRQYTGVNMKGDNVDEEQRLISIR